jgi:hypothetical protein
MKSKEVALTVYRSSVPPEQSFERVIDEIKVKQGFQTRSTLNFSKALEDLSSARYSHGEYCLNNFASWKISTQLTSPLGRSEDENDKQQILTVYDPSFLMRSVG